MNIEKLVKDIANRIYNDVADLEGSLTEGEWVKLIANNLEDAFSDINYPDQKVCFVVDDDEVKKVTEKRIIKYPDSVHILCGETKSIDEFTSEEGILYFTPPITLGED